MNIKLVISIFAFCLNLMNAQTKTGKDFYLIDIPNTEKLHPFDKHLIDSVLNVYHSSISDSVKIAQVRILTENIYDNSIWPVYNKLLFNLVKDRNDNFSLGTKAITINNFGYESQYLKNDLESAAKYYNQALEMYRGIKSEEGIAAELNNLAYISQFKGDVLKAIQLYTEANTSFLKQNNHRGLISTNLNLGEIFYRNQDFIKAEEYFKLSYYHAKMINYKSGLGASLHQIANIYRERGERNKARRFYHKSLNIQMEINDVDRIPGDYIGIAATYAEEGNLNKAEIYYKKALDILSKTSNKHTKASVFDRAAGFYLQMGNERLCYDYSDSAYNYAKNIEHPEIIMSSSKRMGELMAKRGMMDKAYKYLSESYLMRDSIFNDKKRSDATREQYKLEYEKKELLMKEDQVKKELIRTAEKRTQGYFNIALMVVILSVSIVLFFVYRNFKAKKRSEIILQEKNKLIAHQKEIVEEKQKEILDSINYAKRIQYTLLAHHDFLIKNLPNHFVLFQPKDIVSGDFYWATMVNSPAGKRFYLAVCDSTGHGVPGAFMSLLNISFLNEAITERNIVEPNLIFNHVRQRLIESISQQEQKDGFDGILICVETDSNKITYAAANNAPILIRDNQIIQLECDRMPVGKGERKEEFQLFTINPQVNDSLYLYTDGYADQFGGPKGKKFKYKPLNELILSINNKELIEQQSILSNTLSEWKGKLEQVDDVCIIGIRL